MKTKNRKSNITMDVVGENKSWEQETTEEVQHTVVHHVLRLTKNGVSL